MSVIEITSTAGVAVSTPVSIQLEAAQLPAGEENLWLRDEQSGHASPAQRTAEGVVALVGPFEAGEARRFVLEPAPSLTPGVTVQREGDDRLAISLPQTPFTVYNFSREVARPFCYPVFGPGGKNITRHFPMQDVEGEMRDHPHHRSLWTAYGEVNGVDDWSEQANHGWIRHHDFTEITQGPVFGGFTATALWTHPDGKTPLLSETRTIRVYNVLGDRRLLDYEVTFFAEHGDVHFGDTKEGGILSFRVPTTMDGNKGGRIENADGGVGEKETWGKQSVWCDYSGPVEGEHLGIAVMDNPGNFRAPCHWHVRDYGLMTTNVFGTSTFEGKPDEKKGDHILKSGESLTFRYRVLLHRGAAAEGQVADVYQGYVQPPTARVA